MKNHIVTLKDGSEYRLTDQQAARTSQAIDAQKNFYLESDYISWTHVVSIKRIVVPVGLLRIAGPEREVEGFAHITQKGEAIKQQIRDRLKNYDPYPEQCREYLENVRKRREQA